MHTCHQVYALSIPTWSECGMCVIREMVPCLHKKSMTSKGVAFPNSPNPFFPTIQASPSSFSFRGPHNHVSHDLTSWFQRVTIRILIHSLHYIYLKLCIHIHIHDTWYTHPFSDLSHSLTSIQLLWLKAL